MRVEEGFEVVVFREGQRIKDEEKRTKERGRRNNIPSPFVLLPFPLFLLSAFS